MRLAALNASLEALPGDGPSMTLHGRIEKFKTDPPSPDWDGAWHIDNSDETLNFDEQE